MGTFWKALVVLLLALPVGAYVTGSVMAGQNSLPDQRAPVIVDDPETTPSKPDPTSTGSPGRPGGATDDDDDGDDRGDTDDEDDGGVEIIRPEPDDIDDDDGDDGGDDDRDDNRGPDPGPGGGDDSDSRGSED